MQNVMLFNVANFGVANLTLQDCLAPLSSDRWKRVSMEVASAGNLNTALGIQSLSSLIPIMQAELYVIQREWKVALQLFDDNIPKIITEGQKRLLPKLLAQCAWCHANLGNAASANAVATEAVENISNCSDLDDLCVLHYRIGAAAKLINNPEMEDYHCKQALIVQKQFEAHQSEAFAMLDKTIQSIAQIKNPT
jgi:hypothetical protein